VFGVTKGKLPSFLVSYRGIEANPEKIRTIEAMRPPAHIKDVQKLMGCLVVLSRFISILAEWALLFFKLLHKSGSFMWTDEAEEVPRAQAIPHIADGYGGSRAWRASPVVRCRNSKSCEHGTGH
jgi:hypothetical protein